MNIRDLEYIVAVADLKSFHLAAKNCHVGQPTLSTQIKKLEEELGLKIFERNNKRVIINQDAVQILEQAREVLSLVENINQTAQQLQDPFSGNLRIGAFPTVASFVLPEFTKKIKKKFPKLKLILYEEKTDLLIEKIKNGEVDCALLAKPLQIDFLEYRNLFDDPFFLAVNRNHALAHKKRINFSKLKDHKLLLLTEGHCLREQALEVCQLAQIEEEDFRATSMQTLLEMVRLGTAATLIPKIAMKKDKDLVFIPFEEPVPTRTIALAWNKISSKKQLFEIIGDFYE